MKPLFSCCLIALVLLAAALIGTQAVNADIAKPKPTPAKHNPSLYTRMVIQPDSKIYEAKLLIDKSSLESLVAQLNAQASNKTLGASIAQSSTRTVIAGVFLFLSVSLAGVWLARSRSPRVGNKQKVAAAAILVIATIGAAAIITRGNAGPPGYVRWKNLPQALSKGEATDGSVAIEVVDAGENGSSGVKLLIPLRTGKTGEDE
jgi:hypothetical protein